MTQELIKGIVENLCLIGDKVVEKVDASVKREVSYELGVQLRELREAYPADQEFGEKRSHIIQEMCDRGFKKPTSESLRRLSLLPEFGELHECEAVGFTNVYKLMEEKWEPLRIQVQAELRDVNIHDKEANKAVSKHVKSLCKEGFAAAKPPVFTEEEVDQLVARARKKTDPVERDALRQQGEARGYYKVLDIDPADFDDEAELIVAVKQVTKSRERKYHPDKNLDNPERFRDEFDMIQRIKEFFNEAK